ncbi:MAG: type II secretion system protein [Patescibacteria group bacterium]
MKQNKGFTLIEMLIVVAIIGLLASVVVLGLGGARERSRDAKRAADIKQIQNGLEAAYINPAGYPTDSSAIAGVTMQGPSGDAYVYEVLTDANGVNTGYKLGACGETTAFTAGTGLCPTALSCTVGQEICAAAGQ